MSAPCVIQTPVTLQYARQRYYPIGESALRLGSRIVLTARERTGARIRIMY